MTPTKAAYRVPDLLPECILIGMVVSGESVDDVATTAAGHGGTHYRIMDDFGETVVVTDTSATNVLGTVHARSTSRGVKKHAYTARVYRCE